MSSEDAKLHGKAAGYSVGSILSGAKSAIVGFIDYTKVALEESADQMRKNEEMMNLQNETLARFENSYELAGEEDPDQDYYEESDPIYTEGKAELAKRLYDTNKEFINETFEVDPEIFFSSSVAFIHNDFGQDFSMRAFPDYHPFCQFLLRLADESEDLVCNIVVETQTSMIAIFWEKYIQLGVKALFQELSKHDIKLVPKSNSAEGSPSTVTSENLKEKEEDNENDGDANVNIPLDDEEVDGSPIEPSSKSILQEGENMHKFASGLYERVRHHALVRKRSIPISNDFLFNCFFDEILDIEGYIHVVWWMSKDHPYAVYLEGQVDPIDECNCHYGLLVCFEESDIISLAILNFQKVFDDYNFKYETFDQEIIENVVHSHDLISSPDVGIPGKQVMTSELPIYSKKKY